MSEKLDAAWLIALGTDVSEGKAVDWDGVQRLATDAETRQLVDSLRQLATVVDAQRSADSQVTGSAPAGRESAATGHWRHLVLYEKVGAGAFGTVYRGWDTQLDREVALKLLSKPRGAGESPLSEARHLARVRHPNVVTIYGAEQDHEQVGIWMEFIQGDTLAAMVQQRGAMSAREVAGIGIDLCRALSALHSVSLLHRDIKAHNVMREVGGRIVLMDFSGVRALVDPDSPGDLSGTPLYMAPELFEGGGATVSSDIYSLGVLLFFLLSGRYPVEGGTVSDLKVAHAESTRTRLRDLRPELPEAIVQIVERACASDARVRPHTVGEVEHALMGALGTHVLPSSSVIGETVEAAAARAEKTRRRGWFVATAAVAALILLLAAWPNTSPAPEPLVVRLTVGPPYNNLSWPRVSPDGRQIVYGTIVARNIDGKVVGQEFLWVWPLDAFEGRPLLEAAARETAFWSADSQHVGYFEGGKLKRVGVNGGPPQVLCDALNPRGGDWNADGVILFASDTGIHRVPAGGGAVEAVTSLDKARGETQHSWPEFLPDGRRFLYLVRSQREEHAGIYLGALDSPVRKRLMPAYSRTVYAPSGHLLFVQGGTVMAQPFDERSEQLVGDAIALATPVKYHESSDAGFDVSNNGVLIYRLPEGPMRLQMYDRRGLQLQEVAGVGFYRHPRLSPDGQRVAVERFEPGASTPDIWLYDTQGRSTRFTSDEAPDLQPAWSPDGRRIAFSSKRGPQYDVYVKTVDGTEPEQLLNSSPGNKYVESWSADGQYLVVSIVRSGLWLVPLRDGAKPVLVRASPTVQDWQAEMSADGKWISYVSSESGRAEVYVEPVPGTGARWQISSAGGSDPHWRGDSRELIYMSPDGSLMSVDMSAAPRFQAGAARRLFRIAVSEPLGPSDWSLSRDGEFALVNALVGDTQAPPIHVVVNWPRLVGQ